MSAPLYPLITTSELAQCLSNPDLIIVDCRHNLGDPDAGTRAYAAGHIPHARFMHLDQDLSGKKTGRNGRHPLPDPCDLAVRLGALGINNTTHVVAYDEQSMFSPRLWWLLRWLGHERVQVLDGGLQKWLHEGRPVSSEPPAAKPTAYIPHPDDTLLVDVDFVSSHLDDQSWQVIDARAYSRFRGEGETIDPVGGHIPGAKNRFFMDNLNETGCHRSPESIRAAFHALVPHSPADHIIHQCGSGVTACANILAMEVAGLKGSRLYPGSWSEWCSDPARPVATGG